MKVVSVRDNKVEDSIIAQPTEENNGDILYKFLDANMIAIATINVFCSYNFIQKSLGGELYVYLYHKWSEWKTLLPNKFSKCRSKFRNPAYF